MDVERLTEKLDAYLARLKAGEAQKIRPGDLEKVIARLQVQRSALADEAARTPEQADRLQAQIDSADVLLQRAAWLLTELSGTGAPVTPDRRKD